MIHLSKVYILYNPLAGNGTCAAAAEGLKQQQNEESVLCDMTKLENYSQFFSSLSEKDILILCGGDGTLNRFINDTEGCGLKHEILYYPAGSGNDFAHDVGHSAGDQPFGITDYLKDLPLVEVNGKKYRFINGIGYGIDGYCCEVGDAQRKRSDKPVNYTAIAIKGLLFHYKPKNAVVTVDGKTKSYQKVWLAPTMNGRFYGGGMMPTPAQDRKASEKTLSTMVLFGAGKLKTLMVFPSIFKGAHVTHTEMVEVLTGHDITVEFDRPTALQIDGETILNVTSYRAVYAPVTEKQPATAALG